MSGVVPLEQWPDRLEQAIRLSDGFFRRSTVLFETTSTQDAAKRQEARPGDVVTAWRQTGGRGRLGRAWADTEHHGAAMTCVVEAGPPERMALAAAVGAASGLESIAARRLGIKWPNDVVCESRKLAGILIERADGRAFIGVGVNVSQAAWPPDLAARAVSLRQIGVQVDRLEVILAVLAGLACAWAMSDGELERAFGERDALVGREASFRFDGAVIAGRVLRVDPLRGLLVQAAGGEKWLPAALTSVVQDDPVSGR